MEKTASKCLGMLYGKVMLGSVLKGGWVGVYRVNRVRTRGVAAYSKNIMCVDNRHIENMVYSWNYKICV